MYNLSRGRNSDRQTTFAKAAHVFRPGAEAISLACPLAAVCIAVGCIRRWEQREIYYMYKVGFLAFEPAPVLH